MSIGDSWDETCSAEGWPIPKVDWYRNGNLIKDDSNISDEIPFVIKHHRHLNTSSRLFIKSVTSQTFARYECLVNGKSSLKNVTLKLKKENGKKEDNDDSPISRHTFLKHFLKKLL